MIGPGSDKNKTQLLNIEGGGMSKAIWAMAIWTDLFSKRGFPYSNTYFFLIDAKILLPNCKIRLLTKVQVDLSKTVVVFKKSYTKISTWFWRWHKFTQAYTSTLFCGDKHKHKPLIVKRTRTNTRACPLKKTITITDSCPAMPCNWTLPSLLPEPPLFSLLHLHPAPNLLQYLIFNAHLQLLITNTSTFSTISSYYLNFSNNNSCSKFSS